jgi:DNA-binding FrmR family transcriptional regulator
MTQCQKCTRKAHHSDELKKNILNRLKRIEGQVRGVYKMIDENTYCDDVLTQITAIRSALSAVSQQLFEAHLNSCILEQIQGGSTEVMNELQKTIKKIMKG